MLDKLAAMLHDVNTYVDNKSLILIKSASRAICCNNTIAQRERVAAAVKAEEIRNVNAELVSNTNSTDNLLVTVMV